MNQQQGLIKITDHVHDPAVKKKKKKCFLIYLLRRNQCYKLCVQEVATNFI